MCLKPKTSIVIGGNNYGLPKCAFVTCSTFKSPRIELACFQGISRLHMHLSSVTAPSLCPVQHTHTQTRTHTLIRHTNQQNACVICFLLRRAFCLPCRSQCICFHANVLYHNHNQSIWTASCACGRFRQTRSAPLQYVAGLRGFAMRHNWCNGSSLANKAHV